MIFAILVTASVSLMAGASTFIEQVVKAQNTTGNMTGSNGNMTGTDAASGEISAKRNPQRYGP